MLEDDSSRVFVAPASARTFEALLDLLGWKISKGDKRLDFSEFGSLGLLFDYRQITEGVILLANKLGRVEKTCQMIDEILMSGRMNFQQAFSVRERISYAAGQTFYRVCAALCRLLSKWAMERGYRWLTEEMRLALSSGAAALLGARPRIIGPVSAEPPVIIFTDGACEAVTSVGGVIIDP